MPMDYRNFARINGDLVYDPEGRLEAEHMWPKKRIKELSKISNDKKVDKILAGIESGLKLNKASHRILDKMSEKCETEDEND